MKRPWRILESRNVMAVIVGEDDRLGIFRNESKELLELKLRQIEDVTRTLAGFLTADEFEEESRKAEIAAIIALKKTRTAKTVALDQPPAGVESWIRSES